MSDAVGDTGSGSDGPADAPDVDHNDRLRRRTDRIHARNRQLEDRVQELAERRAGGPRPDEAERAREHAVEAQEHARAAHEQAAVVHDEAAAVHLRVADTLDRFGRTDRAREHRVAAAADRDDAVSERAAAERAAPGGDPAQRDA